MSKSLTPFYTADQHFDHHKILLYQSDTRPFKNIEEMNTAWIEAWNKKVPKEGAIVYHLGDLVFKGIERAEEILERLHFEVLEVVPGNHDRWANKNRGPYWHKLFKSRRPIGINSLYHQIEIEGQAIVLCHFPMRSWNASYYGSWHLYGHVHRYIEPWGMSMDVGVDGAEGIPYSHQEVCEYMAQRRRDLRELREGKRHAV